MKQPKSARDCSKVYLQYPGDRAQISFATRGYNEKKKFAWTPFQSDRAMDVDLIEDLLKDKQQELAKLKEEAKKREEERKKEARRKKAEEEGRILKEKQKRRVHPKLTWKQKVNARRKQVAACLRLQTQPSLSEIMRWTGCSFYMVQKVAEDLAFNQEVVPYQYPNQKTPAQLTQLSQSIDKVNGTFATIADVKRKNPGFSRKFIAKKLRQTGHHWIRVRKNELKPKEETYRDHQVLATVRHLSQSLLNSQVETYYIDEVHFPLWQTSDRHWTKAQFQGHDLLYNRRFCCGEKLSVIAMCSTERFVAVQVFQKDICGLDFLYFLQEAMTRIPTSAKVTVLADNATWHTAAVVMNTAAAKAIEFNAPGLFQANMIENAFSFVRAEFRKRPDSKTYEDETRQLLRIFFDDRNTKRFAGIYRNHIRSLLALLFKHYAAIQSRLQELNGDEEEPNLTEEET